MPLNAFGEPERGMGASLPLIVKSQHWSTNRTSRSLTSAVSSNWPQPSFLDIPRTNCAFDFSVYPHARRWRDEAPGAVIKAAHLLASFAQTPKSRASIYTRKFHGSWNYSEAA